MAENALSQKLAILRYASVRESMFLEVISILKKLNIRFTEDSKNKKLETFCLKAHVS